VPLKARKSTKRSSKCSTTSSRTPRPSLFSSHRQRPLRTPTTTLALLRTNRAPTAMRTSRKHWRRRKSKSKAWLARTSPPMPSHLLLRLRRRRRPQAHPLLRRPRVTRRLRSRRCRRWVTAHIPRTRIQPRSPLATQTSPTPAVVPAPTSPSPHPRHRPSGLGRGILVQAQGASHRSGRGRFFRRGRGGVHPAYHGPTGGPGRSGEH